jgi:hypothetical protein
MQRYGRYLLDRVQKAGWLCGAFLFLKKIRKNIWFAEKGMQSKATIALRAPPIRGDFLIRTVEAQHPGTTFV